jgi:hypothetical protein
MLALLLLATLPHSPATLTDRVDRIELNHVQCPQTGRETLTQVIYWRWHECDQTHHVTAWRMVDRRPSLLRRDGREWVETWEDGPVRREIRAAQFRETWTLHDPEVEDRATVSPEMRRGLNALPIR